MESEGGREREKKEEVEGRRGRGGEGEGKDESRIQSLESNEQVHTHKQHTRQSGDEGGGAVRVVCANVGAAK